MAFGRDGQRTWSINLGAEVVGSPLVHDQTVGFLTSDGIVHLRALADAPNVARNGSTCFRRLARSSWVTDADRDGERYDLSVQADRRRYGKALTPRSVGEILDESTPFEQRVDFRNVPRRRDRNRGLEFVGPGPGGRQGNLCGGADGSAASRIRLIA